MRKGKIFIAAIPLMLGILCFLPFSVGSEQGSEREKRELEKAESFCRFGDKAYEKKEYVRAKEFYISALEIREKILGLNHLDVAECLICLAKVQIELKEYTKAEELYIRALQIKIKNLNPDHLDVARCLEGMGWLYFMYLRDNKLAENAYRRALSIYENNLGKGCPEGGWCRYFIWQIHLARGDYSSLFQTPQQEIYTSTLTKREEIELKKSEKLREQGIAAVNEGNYKKAEELYKNALAIRKKVLKPEHPEIAISLMDLADLYRRIGNYPDAEQLLKRALSISKKVSLGLDHPLVALNYYHFGFLYYSMGDYFRAVSYYEKSIDIWERFGAPENPRVADCYNNLSVVYIDIGDYYKAKQALENALDIYRKGPEQNDIKLVPLINNLGVISYYKGDYPSAEKHYNKALFIAKKYYGNKSPDVAICFNNLADVHLQMCNYSHARKYYEKALAINIEVYTYDHPTVAISIRKLGYLCDVTGDYSCAEENYNNALEILDKTLGRFNRYSVNICQTLAELNLDLGKWEKAYPLAKRSFQTKIKLAENLFSFTSERQKLIYQKQLHSILDVYLSAVLMGKNNPELVSRGYDAVVRSKGIVLESLVGERYIHRQLVQEGMIPNLMQTHSELIRVRSQISSLYYDGTITDIPIMRSLLNREEDLESNLSRESAVYGRVQKRLWAGFGDICKYVPKDSVLIDYVRFERPVPPENPTNSGWIPWMVAFLVNGGNCGPPELVDLGPLEPIHETVKTWRKVLDASGDAGQKYSLMREGKDLAELVWKPVAEKIPSNIKTVYIAPDGPLHLLPFAALPDSDGNYLIKSYDIGYATTAKDFLPKPAPHSRQEKIFLLGAPDFDQSVISAHEECPGNMLFTNDDLVKLDSSEVISIANKLKSKGKSPEVLTGPRATESLVKKVAKSVSILHLATHGFFSQGKKHGRQRTGLGSFNSAPVFMDNPLLLSGLALAGANNSCRRDDGDDGVLFALEVANLDLRGVELVVLSACNTGRGEVLPGEGVFGLKRSFIIAGAEGLVVSLWSVRDDSTRNLMVSFYDILFKTKDFNPQKALRLAQLQMIEELRKGGFSDHPYQWAAFQYVR